MLVGTSLKEVAAVFIKGKIIFLCTVIFLVFLHPLIVMPYGSRPAAMEMARQSGDIYERGKVMLVTGSPPTRYNYATQWNTVNKFLYRT